MQKRTFKDEVSGKIKLKVCPVLCPRSFVFSNFITHPCSQLGQSFDLNVGACQLFYSEGLDYDPEDRVGFERDSTKVDKANAMERAFHEISKLVSAFSCHSATHARTHIHVFTPFTI